MNHSSTAPPIAADGCLEIFHPTEPANEDQRVHAVELKGAAVPLTWPEAMEHAEKNTPSIKGVAV